MPKVSNRVIDQLLIQQKKADQAMSSILRIPDGSYKKRATFHGTGPNSADWQGPMGGPGDPFIPGTNDLMPGTTPIFPKATAFEKLLEFLKIKPKRKKPMPLPKIKHPGFM
mgnify:CR=1 FL=1|tara:strand:+ start:275 stop:607 length:333 start_codon:yes stop_codon:yes gene_type:complete